MSDMVRFVEVQGWQVAVEGVGNSEAKIRDFDLARKLRFSRPRDIKKLISRMITTGQLSGVCMRDTVARINKPGGGVEERAVSEFWLTEEQALKIIARSETEVASVILDQMIRVFVLVRKYGFSLPVTPDSGLEALQLKTAHLQAAKPYFDAAFQQIEKLEASGSVDKATASAHRTQLLLTIAGIDLTKAPVLKYESTAPKETIALNSPLVENVKAPGDLPKVGIGFNAQVDRTGFHYAHKLGEEFGVSGDIIGKLARAAGIFQKITPVKNEYGFTYSHPHGVEGKTKEAWMYSEKSRDILRAITRDFIHSYNTRSLKKTSKATVAAAIGKEWKDKQPLIEPTVASAPN